MRDNSNDLASSLVEELIGTHDRQEPVRIHLLAKAIKEDREIMKVVEVFGLDSEVDLIDGSLMVNQHW